MTNAEKLNAILYALLNEVRNEKPNPKLTFEFICLTLCEVKENWEINFLRNTLIEDEYISMSSMLNVLPKITHKGIKFIQQGGYKKENENRDLDNKIKVETLKNLNRSKTALIISAISVIISCFIGFINYNSSLKRDSLENQIDKQKKTLDSISNLLRNQKNNETLKP